MESQRRLQKYNPDCPALHNWEYEAQMQTFNYERKKKELPIAVSSALSLYFGVFIKNTKTSLSLHYFNGVDNTQ